MKEQQYLTQLDRIDWHHLGYPDMPKWIRGLTSHSEDIRKASYDSLYDNRADYLSDASPYVARFLVEILSYDNIQQKEEILNLLMLLASESEAFAHQPRYAQSSAHTLMEIEKGIEIYFQNLDNQMQLGITLEILGYLKKQAQIIVPKLYQLIQANEIGEATPAAIYTLNELLQNSEIRDIDRYVSLFVNRLADQYPSEVRLASAFALPSFLKEKTPVKAIALLKETIIASHRKRYTPPLIKAVLELGNNQSIDCFLEIFPHLTSTSFGNVHEIAPLLFDLGFNEGQVRKYTLSHLKIDGKFKKINYDFLSDLQGEREPNTVLSALQYRILAAIIENEHIWEHETNLFSLYGLPNSRDQMEQLLNKHNK